MVGERRGSGLDHGGEESRALPDKAMVFTLARDAVSAPTGLDR